MVKHRNRNLNRMNPIDQINEIKKKGGGGNAELGLAFLRKILSGEIRGVLEGREEDLEGKETAAAVTAAAMDE